MLNIGALVMDPNDPNTLYAGTGEWYTGFAGQGIFKTSDGGATWNQLARTSLKMTNNFEYVNKLVMSPTTPNRLYAATWGGVFTSADGGNTWTPTGLSTTDVYYGCQDLAIRTDQTTDYLFASCRVYHLAKQRCRRRGNLEPGIYGAFHGTNVTGDRSVAASDYLRHGHQHRRGPSL